MLSPSDHMITRQSLVQEDSRNSSRRRSSVACQAGVELADVVERIRVGGRFVGTQAGDTGKTQSESGLVAAALLNGVEGDLQHDFRGDGADGAVTGCRDLAEVRAHGSDLFVGQARVGLSDVDELIAAAHGEGVVGEHSGSLAVALLNGSDDDVESRGGLLPLAPGPAALARLVERVPLLQDQPLVSSIACSGDRKST